MLKKSSLPGESSILVNFYQKFLLPSYALLRVYYFQWGNFLPLIFLNIIRLFLAIVQVFTWRYAKITRHRQEISRKLKNGDNLLAFQSVQVLKVWFRCKPTPFDKVYHQINILMLISKKIQVRRCFFLTTHDSFVSPDFVYNNDRVILAEVSRTSALFIELPETIDKYVYSDLTLQIK